MDRVRYSFIRPWLRTVQCFISPATRRLFSSLASSIIYSRNNSTYLRERILWCCPPLGMSLRVSLHIRSPKQLVRMFSLLRTLAVHLPKVWGFNPSYHTIIKITAIFRMEIIVLSPFTHFKGTTFNGKAHSRLKACKAINHRASATAPPIQLHSSKEEMSTRKSALNLTLTVFWTVVHLISLRKSQTSVLNIFQTSKMAEFSLKQMRSPRRWCLALLRRCHPRSQTCVQPLSWCSYINKHTLHKWK